MKFLLIYTAGSAGNKGVRRKPSQLYSWPMSPRRWRSVNDDAAA